MALSSPGVESSLEGCELRLETLNPEACDAGVHAAVRSGQDGVDPVQRYLPPEDHLQLRPRPQDQGDPTSETAVGHMPQRLAVARNLLQHARVCVF